MSEVKFSKFLSSGSLDGFFSHDEFWKFYEDVRKTSGNSNFLTKPESIGRTFENREMNGFYICDNTSDLDRYASNKNIIFLTSLL